MYLKDTFVACFYVEKCVWNVPLCFFYLVKAYKKLQSYLSPLGNWDPQVTFSSTLRFLQISKINSGHYPTNWLQHGKNIFRIYLKDIFVVCFYVEKNTMYALCRVYILFFSIFVCYVPCTYICNFWQSRSATSVTNLPNVISC